MSTLAFHSSAGKQAVGALCLCQHALKQVQWPKTKQLESAPVLPRVTGECAQTGWRQSIIQAPWMQRCLKYAVVCGVGMIFGDGCLTPSISGKWACSIASRSQTNPLRCKAQQLPAAVAAAASSCWASIHRMPLLIET